MTKKEAQKIIADLLELKKQHQKTKNSIDLKNIKKQERLCYDSFKYIVISRAKRYQQFSNYDDLKQEGFEALMLAINSYNPKKGDFFWWAHKYIDTRIARCASLYITIKYPLKALQKQIPSRESVMPLMVEYKNTPEKIIEDNQLLNAVGKAIDGLTNNQKKVLQLVFGLSGSPEMSITKICRKMNISRINCLNMLNSAISSIRNNIVL